MRKYSLLFIFSVFVFNAYADDDCCNKECTCHWDYDAETKTSFSTQNSFPVTIQQPRAHSQDRSQAATFEGALF